MENIFNSEKDQFIELNDSIFNCYECFTKTPCYNVMTAQYCSRQPRPKYLANYPFKKRVRMEFSLSRKSLAKFLEAKGTTPIVELPDLEQNLRASFSVWEMVRRMSEWTRCSLSSLASEKRAPIIEEPIQRIKEFPLTQESVKKHIEKETAKKKEEKQETVLMLKKKQQELKKLKDELLLQTEKYYCHHNEKLADYEEEKMKYLKKLADEHSLRLKDLVRNGDKIYQNYRSEMKKLNEWKMKEIEKRAEVNARLLQEELTRQKQLKKMKSTSVPKFILKKPKIAKDDNDSSDSKYVSVITDSSEPKTSESSATPSKWKLIKSSHSAKKQVIESDRQLKVKSKQNKVDIELKDLIKKLEEVWNELDNKWSEETKELDLPDNDLLIVRPTTIVFKDFLPYDDHVKTVNVYNPTKESIDCGFFKIHAVPQFNENMFEIYPELVKRIRPGGKQEFQVVFMTERWDEVRNGINGVIWFWSKVLKTNNFYRIPISIQCTRFTSNIQIENPIIEFNQIPSWVHESSTKYLEITNNSKIDYEVYIHRKNQKKEEETESTSITSSSTLLEEESKLIVKSTIDTTSSKSNQKLSPECKKDDKKCKEQPMQPPVSILKHTHYKSPEQSEQLVEQSLQDKPKHKNKEQGKLALDHISSGKQKSKNLERAKQPADQNVPEKRKNKSPERVKQPTDQHSPEKLNNESPDRVKQAADQNSPEKWKNKSLDLSKHRRREVLHSRDHFLSTSQGRISGKTKDQATQKKNALREESLSVADDLMQSMLEEVHQPFRIQLTRGVFLERETKMCVPIDFLPQLAGNVERVEDQLIVSFEGRFLTRGEEVVTLIATMFELPLSISPAMVDMQVTMIGTGVWQTSFQVTNISKKFVKVKIYIPKNMNKHFQARPKSFLIRPNQTEDVLLRARIGWDICEDSGDMLDRSLSLLEFPISIQADDLPHQKLGALAVISHPLALTIDPTSINLGFVNTSETVIEEFWLKNLTVIPLHFAFVNVPECCLIMPLHGFSVIGPAQKIKLQIVYSPGLREAGKPGNQAVHMFTLICTTLERMAAEKTSILKFNPDEEVTRTSKVIPCKIENEQMTTLHELLKMSADDYMSEMGDIPKGFETLSFLNENLHSMIFQEKKEVITPIEPRVLKKTMYSENFYSADVIRDKSTIKQDMDSIDVLIASNDRNNEPFITLDCMAIVTDPICEFSAQELILPDTPYGSYSIYFFYLRCPNEVSGYSCHCKRFVGLHDEQNQHLHMKFQFFHDRGKELDVQPISGKLNYGEKVKVYFTLKPELDLQESSKEGKLRRGKSTIKAVSKNKPDPKTQAKVPESNITRAVLSRIKNKPNTNFHTRVKCVISIKTPDSPDLRYEELYCDLYSKFVRPDIYAAIPNLKKEIVFPKTAIGTKRVETIDVYNLSNKLVHVTRSHFSHKGIFYCQPLPPSPWCDNQYRGVPLEPDEFLRLHLSFSPVEDNNAEEYFELKANSTIIPLKVSGSGVIPRYMFSSQFSVCKMEASFGSKVEDIITITNKCEAELPFEIMKCYEMETTNSDVFRIFLNRYYSPAKGIYKESYLDKSIIEDIKEHFYESDQPSPITIEPKMIHIQPSKKGVIKISFYPKKPINLIETKSRNQLEIKNREGSPHGKVDHYGTKRGSPTSKSTIKMEELLPTFYVQKVQVILGRLTLVSEWLIIGKIVRDNKKRV